MEFLEIRCRCKRKDSPLECRTILGGFSLETLLSHNFEVSPFIDIRYCSLCHSMIKVTIKNLEEIPLIEAMPKSERIAFVKPENLFKFVEVHR